QQMIEIAKALMTNAKIIVMDEPTAALTDKEINQLFKLIKSLQKQGVAFVYISHRMAEIFEISDEITVMRDGKTVLYKETNDTNYDEIVKSMVGRDLTEQFPKRTVSPSNIILAVNVFMTPKNHIQYKIKSMERKDSTEQFPKRNV